MKEIQIEILKSKPKWQPLRRESDVGDERGLRKKRRIEKAGSRK